MAVLVEANSVIVRTDAILARMPGGEAAFISLVPNQTYCSDGQLARAGFTGPVELGEFIDSLTRAGLRYLEDGKAVDFVVVDQLRGPTRPCDWIEFAHLPFEPDHTVAACWLFEGPRSYGAGIYLKSLHMAFVTPETWKYEGSLSEEATFVPQGEAGKHLVLMDTYDDIVIYLDTESGKMVSFPRRPGPKDA